MRRRARQFVLLLGMLFLLSGCLSQSGEEFYLLPQLPEDYLALQNAISQVMDSLGAEYAAPTSGANIQNIQLQDLDGDGEPESAVTFFRVPSAEKPLKIYIFRQNQTTEEYETAWIIEGDGTAIYSVSFEDLGGGTNNEIIVGWQISTGVQTLAAYSLLPSGDVAELMRSGYTKSAVVDLDRDNDKEIVLVQFDTAENNSRAELYNYDDGLMVLTSVASLSRDISDIKTAKVGSLIDQIPALFIFSDIGMVGESIIDIIALRDGVLTNVTLEEESGISVGTSRFYTDFQNADGMDIDNDGILELPMPLGLPTIEGVSAQQMYLLRWNQYNLSGEAVRVCTTFHCYDDGWYLILPEDWKEKVIVARRSNTNTNERSISFYYLQGAPEEFLTIYRLSGSNRTYRATMDDRFVLFESADVTYAAKFWDIQWDCGLDKDQLRERFNRIKVDWSADS